MYTTYRVAAVGALARVSCVAVTAWMGPILPLRARRRLARSLHHAGCPQVVLAGLEADRPAENTFFLNFSYVCPEPVLVK